MPLVGVGQPAHRLVEPPLEPGPQLQRCRCSTPGAAPGAGRAADRAARRRVSSPRRRPARGRRPRRTSPRGMRVPCRPTRRSPPHTPTSAAGPRARRSRRPRRCRCRRAASRAPSRGSRPAAREPVDQLEDARRGGREDEQQEHQPDGGVQRLRPEHAPTIGAASDNPRERRRQRAAAEASRLPSGSEPLSTESSARWTVRAKGDRWRRECYVTGDATPAWRGQAARSTGDDTAIDDTAVDDTTVDDLAEVLAALRVAPQQAPVTKAKASRLPRSRTWPPRRRHPTSSEPPRTPRRTALVRCGSSAGWPPQ